MTVFLGYEDYKKNEILYIKSLNTCTHFVYFKSVNERKYDKFVDLNIRIYKSFEL